MNWKIKIDFQSSLCNCKNSFSSPGKWLRDPNSRCYTVLGVLSKDLRGFCNARRRFTSASNWFGQWNSNRIYKHCRGVPIKSRDQLNLPAFPLFFESIKIVVLGAEAGADNRFLVARVDTRPMSMTILLKIENVLSRSRYTESCRTVSPKSKGRKKAAGNRFVPQLHFTQFFLESWRFAKSQTFWRATKRFETCVIAYTFCCLYFRQRSSIFA